MLQAADDVKLTGIDGIDEQLSLDRQKILGINHLESLGLLNSGFIHSINNVLGVLYGYIELASEEIASNLPQAEYLRQAILSTDKIRLLVQLLHQFGRKSPAVENLFELSRECELPISMARSVFPSSIKIESHWPETECWVRLCPRTWHQILLNVIINAKESMPEGGSIGISLRKMTNETCCLSIQDHGCGMTPEILARALIPFFTTKASGEGSGLGLTVARFALEQMGGRLRLESVAGEGTQVYLTLPLSKEPAPGISCRSF